MTTTTDTNTTTSTLLDEVIAASEAQLAKRNSADDIPLPIRNEATDAARKAYHAAMALDATDVAAAKGAATTTKGGDRVPRDRPMLFTGDMVLAILAGTKTQTRRIEPFTPDEHRAIEPRHRRR